MPKKGTKRTKSDERPTFDFAAMVPVTEIVERPVSQRALHATPPPLTEVHRMVLATHPVPANETRKAVKIPITNVKHGKALVSALRSDLRRNGHADVSVMGEYHQTYVKVWAGSKRKRASRKSAPVPVADAPAVEA